MIMKIGNLISTSDVPKVSIINKNIYFPFPNLSVLHAIGLLSVPTSNCCTTWEYARICRCKNILCHLLYVSLYYTLVTPNTYDAEKKRNSSEKTKHGLTLTLW